MGLLILINFVTPHIGGRGRTGKNHAKHLKVFRDFSLSGIKITSNGGGRTRSNLKSIIQHQFFCAGVSVLRVINFE